MVRLAPGIWAYLPIPGRGGGQGDHADIHWWHDGSLAWRSAILRADSVRLHRPAPQTNPESGPLFPIQLSDLSRLVDSYQMRELVRLSVLSCVGLLHSPCISVYASMNNKD